MTGDSSGAIWAAVIALYRAGELHQEALEAMARSRPADATSARIAEALKESQDALLEAFGLFRIKADAPDEEDED